MLYLSIKIDWRDNIVNEQRLGRLTSELKQKLGKYRQEYTAEKESEATRIQNWQYESESVLKELDYLINSLNPQMAGKLKNIISKTKGRYGSSVSIIDIDFDKLTYYIDRVNDLNIPNNVIQKNPRFCETVLATIADEYLKIKAYIANEKNAKQKELDVCKKILMDEYKMKATREWTKLCDQDIKTLSQEETDSIIQRIRLSI